MFGRIFPAKDSIEYHVFIADEMPGRFGRAVLRLETRAPGQNLRVEAWVNGTRLEALAASEPELFPPVAVNRASARRENLTFFTVSVSALMFGINRIQVKNLDRGTRSCDFVSSELALYQDK
jgi:hypothetical protein